MINITADETKLFEQNGFTKEQVGATVQHYREQGLSDDEIQNKMNAKINEFRGSSAPNRGIDLTPSGLVKQGLATALAPVRGALYGEDFKTARQNALQNTERFKPAKGAGDFLVDMYGYSQLPILRTVGGAGKAGQIGRFVGNAAIQGGIPGALEGLKEGENPLKSAGTGTGIATILPPTLKGIGKVVNPIINKTGSVANKLFLNAFPGLKEKTVRQLIKPNSQALDLTEDTAQNLLMDTTERVQRDYKNLLDNAGLEVQKAALNLPEERGVFASSLKNSLDDIYAGTQVSKNKSLNPAMQGDKDIYKKIMNWIDLAENKDKLTASEMYDLMGNIKRNIPIDWDKSGANARNALKQQIYNDFGRRLGNLSPELRKANAAYARLAKFQDNEGVRQILNPPKKGDIDLPSTKLSNYNATLTSGNKRRNITDLENLFVNNGKEPFLDTVDDINAANELLKSPGTGINPIDLLQTIKKNVERPILKTARGLNRMMGNNPLRNVNPEAVQRLLNPLAVRLASPMLYGGISNEDDF